MRYLAMLFAVCAIGVSTAVAQQDQGSAAALSGALALEHEAQVPSGTLKPGMYTLEIVDHLADRIVLRVRDRGGKDKGIFLGVPTAALPVAAQGAVPWEHSGNGHRALRGFVFPGGSALEFVYPKTEAVTLAQKNDVQVPAIDPESEDAHLHAKNLSSDDLQILKLWSLSPTRIGPNLKTAAIQAKPWTTETASASTVSRQVTPAASPAPSLVAEGNATPAPSTRPHASDQKIGPRPFHLTALTANRDHSARENASSRPLPQTASPLPLLVMLGCAFLAVGVSMKGLRSQSYGG